MELLKRLKYNLRRNTLSAIVLATFICLQATQAFAVPVNPSGDLINSVSGNVYLTNPPSANSGQFWANGAWHDFSEIMPANKASDGPARDIGNGWYIQWMGGTNGGEFMFWRSHTAWSYGGSTWPGFKVRFNNIGYTSKGEQIDSILDFSSVYAWKFDETPSPTWFSPFEITTNYGPIVGATTTINGKEDTTPVGVKSEYTTTFVKHGTETPIDSDNEVDLVYWDIDRPVMRPDHTNDYTSEWREGIHLIDGYKSASVGNNSTVQVSDNGTWFRSTQNDFSTVPDNLSSVVAKAGPQFTTEWRGYSCSTGIGYDTRVIQYPEWTDPVKSPPEQIRKHEEVATFDVTETFPYVAESNKAQSIVMKDTLDPALDASKATVKVFKDGVDVTDNWDIAISGQTVTATAKNTGHGYAESTHVFRITAPVSKTADLSQYERKGDYWKVPNQASVIVNNNEKKTNIVHVLVPYEAKGSVQLKATKTLKGGTLQDGQFTFQLKDENGNVLDTQTNKADGTIEFKKLDFTQEDIDKTYTYIIVETPGTEKGYTYDSHTETVTVKITDAGQSVLNIETTYSSADGAKFANERRLPLSVIKKSSDGNTLLGGAEFTLYKDDGNGVFDSNDQPATVYSDEDLQNVISGSKVTTNDADGLARFYGLEAGVTYWVKETRAPSGYNLDEQAHAIIVAEDGTISTKDFDGNVVPLPVKDNVASITIADEPIPGLPLTAGSGIWMLVGFGGTLITAAVLLFAYQLRKRSQLS